MKFFFCETCGKRITDEQLLAGLARDKKLKGVYCGECARSVMTMEFDALTDQQARVIVGETSAPARATKSRRSGLHAAAPKPVDETVGSSPAVKAAPKSILPIALISGAAFILGGAAFAALLSLNGKPPQSKEDAKIAAPAISATTAGALPPRFPADTPVVSPKQIVIPAMPAVVPPPRTQDQAPVVRDTESAAQVAFDKATRFEGLEKNDAAGRIKRLEEFLASYPDTIVSARARIQIADLKNVLAPKPPPPLPPPPLPAAPAVSAPSAKDVDLFTTARPTLGWNFDNGQEFPGAKGALVVDATVKHGDQESLFLSADFSGGGCYVQMGRDVSALKVDPSVISFWLRAPGVKSISMRLCDSSGQCHQLVQNVEASDDWRQITLPVEKFFAARSGGEACKVISRYEKWGGPNDGKFHGPLVGLYLLAGAVGEGKTVKMWVAGMSAKAKAP